MHYAAIVGDQEREVEINEVSPGRFTIRFDGRQMDVDARFISDSTMSFILDEEAYNIELERNANGGTNILVRGSVVPVEVLDLRRMRLRKAQSAVAGPQGPAAITSPMPGKVVTVLVKEGQEVAEGDGLVVVEAMKMENELRAPRAGVVRDLTAEEGASVEGGAPLCVVE